MPTDYGKLITDVHKAFENEPEKARVVTGVLDHLIDRIKDLEREVVDLKVSVGRTAAQPTKIEPSGGTLR